MSTIPVVDPARQPDPKLPLRDWLVIPAICLVSIVGFSFFANQLAKHYYTEFEDGLDRCTAFVDHTIGDVRRPSACTYTEKTLETDPATFTLNDRGYREDSALKPKAPGTYRIVMVGASFGFGLGAPKDKTIAARLPIEIEKRTGKKVEVYNESIPGFPGGVQNITKRWDDIIAAQPDLILWQMTRWDIKADEATRPDPPDIRQKFSVSDVSRKRVADAFHSHSPKRILLSLVKFGADTARSGKQAIVDSQAGFMLHSWLAHSDSQFLSTYITGADTLSGYMRTKFSPLWADHIALFEPIYREVRAKADAAHVPVAVIVWPTRAQAQQISSGEWDAAIYDPYHLTRDMGDIVHRNGGIYLDIHPLMRNEPDPSRGYIPIDGHPTPYGDVMLARQVATVLTSGVIPELSATQHSTTQDR